MQADLDPLIDKVALWFGYSYAAFAASNSRNSINRALVGYAAAPFKTHVAPQADIEFLDLNDAVLVF